MARAPTTRASRPQASDAVRREWARRVEAEYRSAAITQHLTLWLIQLGLSPTLIESGLRIVKDELAHARLSFGVLGAAGGQAAPPIARETLGIRPGPKDDPLEAHVARACVETFCLGETVAVPLFAALRKECSAPTARRALDRILRDEVRHRDFGWDLLDHLLEQPCAPLVRQVIERDLSRMLVALKASYAPPEARTSREIPEADRAWGLMPGARYAEVLERAIERDHAPRFAARGFDGALAWVRAKATS